MITGTDTGVGKSTVGAGLLAALGARGLSVAAVKPAESGCALRDGVLMAADGALLGAACRPPLAHDEVAPLRYLLPVAPSVAARAAGQTFSLAPTHAALQRAVARGADVVLVEGAGGLLVPYSDTHTTADVAAELGYPVLIVARAALGTINHTLLTVSEARRRGLAVLGVVLVSCSAGDGPDAGTNAREIEHHGDVTVLGTLPRLPDEDRRNPDALGRAVEAALDVAALLARLR